MAKKKTSKKAPVQTKRESKEYKVEFILACKQEADEATKHWREERAELWNVFQCQQDYSKKMDWQAKVFVPKVPMRVIRAASIIKKALLQTQKLFKFEANVKDYAQLRKELVAKRDVLEVNNPEFAILDTAIKKVSRQIDRKTESIAELEKEFKEKLADTNFINIYSSMALSALLTGLGDPKVLWDAVQKKGHFENVDILNLWVSPRFMPHSGSRPPYLIERKEMPLADLRVMATEINEAAGEALFDFDEIDRIAEDYKNLESARQQKVRRGLNEFTPATKSVEILEFWGDLISKDGFSTKKNLAMMLANEKYLIYDHPNPFEHQDTPHNLTYALTFPHSGTKGISIAEPVIKLQYAYNNIFNMFIDNLNYTVNKMFEYDSSRLKHPTDILTVYPGKTIARSGDGRVLEEVQSTPVGQESLAILALCSREMDEGTSVNEMVQGMPGTKQKTKAEVQIKTAEAHGLFDTIARDLEQNSLKPLLEKTYDLYSQFAGMPDRKGLFQIKVGGITLLLAQKEQIETIGQVVAMALKSDELRAMTDLPDLWHKFLSITNLTDAYKDPTATGQLTEGQQVEIEQKAATDAKQVVSQMTPEQIQAA